LRRAKASHGKPLQPQRGRPAALHGAFSPFHHWMIYFAAPIARMRPIENPP
jgi:hypothetical protein